MKRNKIVFYVALPILAALAVVAITLVGGHGHKEGRTAAAFPSASDAGSRIAAFVDGRERAAGQPAAVAAIRCVAIAQRGGSVVRAADGTTPYFVCAVVLQNTATGQTACAQAAVQMDRKGDVVASRGEAAANSVCAGAGL